MKARLKFPLLVVMLAAACSSDPTTSGLAPGEGRGSLIVMREHVAIGAGPRRMVIDEETGAGTTPVSWFPDEERASWGDTFADDVVLSRDGRWMAWVEVTPDTTPEFCDIEGNCIYDDIRRLYVSRVGARTGTLLTPEFHSDYAPSFSPDGGRLVVLREFFNHENQMVTMDLGGGDVKPVLIRRREGRGAPDWAPTGARIVYHRPDRNALYLVDPDGADPQAVLSTPFAGRPAWSPDGKRFAVSVFLEGRRQLAIVASSGTLERMLPIQDEFDGRRLAWSPDGTRIAYCSIPRLVRPGTVVRMIEITTGEDRIVTPPGYNDCDPIWRG